MLSQFLTTCTDHSEGSIELPKTARNKEEKGRDGIKDGKKWNKGRKKKRGKKDYK